MCHDLIIIDKQIYALKGYIIFTKYSKLLLKMKHLRQNDDHVKNFLSSPYFLSVVVLAKNHKMFPSYPFRHSQSTKDVQHGMVV